MERIIGFHPFGLQSRQPYGDSSPQGNPCAVLRRNLVLTGDS